MDGCSIYITLQGDDNITMNKSKTIQRVVTTLQQDLATATDMTELPGQHPRAYGFLAQSVKYCLKDLEIVLAQMAADRRAMDEAEGQGRR